MAILTMDTRLTQKGGPALQTAFPNNVHSDCYKTLNGAKEAVPQFRVLLDQATPESGGPTNIWSMCGGMYDNSLYKKLRSSKIQKISHRFAYTSEVFD